jgi:hypothetical protein
MKGTRGAKQIFLFISFFPLKSVCPLNGNLPESINAYFIRIELIKTKVLAPFFSRVCSPMLNLDPKCTSAGSYTSSLRPQATSACGLKLLVYEAA